jgi:hypothetical protein
MVGAAARVRGDWRMVRCNEKLMDIDELECRMMNLTDKYIRETLGDANYCNLTPPRSVISL